MSIEEAERRYSERDERGRTPWRIFGWRSATVVLILMGMVAASLAFHYAEGPNEIYRVFATLGSISLGGAFLTGFAWKMVVENAVTLVGIKNQLIEAMKEEHAKEVGALKIRMTDMEEELSSVKRLNIALQQNNMALAEAKAELISKIRDLSDSAEKNAITLLEYKELLDLAERKIKLNVDLH